VIPATAHPENAALLARILAAPSRDATQEERAILEAFLRKPRRALMTSEELRRAAQRA
jgi:hypothetical protein